MHFIEFVKSFTTSESSRLYLTAFLKDEGLVVNSNFQVLIDEKDLLSVISSFQSSDHPESERSKYIKTLSDGFNVSQVTIATPVCLAIHVDLSKFGQLFRGLVNLKNCVHKLINEYSVLDNELKTEYLHIVMMRNSEIYCGEAFKTAQDLDTDRGIFHYIVEMLSTTTKPDNREVVRGFDEILDDLLGPDNEDIIQCQIQVPEPRIVDDKDVFISNIEYYAKQLYDKEKLKLYDKEKLKLYDKEKLKLYDKEKLKLYDKEDLTEVPNWGKLGKKQDQYRKAAEINYLKTFLPRHSRSGILAMLILKNKLYNDKDDSDSITNILQLVEEDINSFLNGDENKRRTILLQSVMICDVIQNYNDDPIEERARKLMYRWFNRYNSNDSRRLRAAEADKYTNIGKRWIELGEKVVELSEPKATEMLNILLRNFDEQKRILLKINKFVRRTRSNTQEAINCLPEIYNLKSNYLLGFSPLFWAVYYGNLELVQAIMRNHTNDEDEDKFDCVQQILPPKLQLINDEPWTPLMWACALGHTSIVEILLKGMKDKKIYEKLLSLVILSNNFDAINALETWYNQPVNDPEVSSSIVSSNNVKKENSVSDSWTPLHYFCNRRSLSQNNLEWLGLEANIDTFAGIRGSDCAYMGYKPIHVAIYSRSLEVFRSLICHQNHQDSLWENLMIFIHGLSTKTDSEGTEVTPLYLAARRGCDEIVKKILDLAKSGGDSDMKESLKKSYELLSEEKDLQPAVVWELINFTTIEDDSYHLAKYRTQILNNLEMTALQDIYSKHFITVKPILSDRLDCNEYVSPGKYYINHEKVIQKESPQGAERVIAGASNDQHVVVDSNNQNIASPRGDSPESPRGVSILDFELSFSSDEVLKKKNEGIVAMTSIFMGSYKLYRKVRYFMLSYFLTLGEVSEYVINLRHTASLWFISDLVLNIDRHLGSDVLKLDFVKASIQCAWESYGLFYHYLEMIAYIVYMIYYGYYNYSFNSHSRYEKKRLTSATIALSTLLVAYLMLKFITHVVHKRWRVVQFYLSHYHTWAEITSFILTIVACVKRIESNYEESHSSANVMAFATLLVYVKIMHIFSPFESTGPLIGMIEAIIWGIKYYLMIIFLVVVAFALSLYILSYAAEDPNSGVFTDRSNGLLNVYNYMLGSINFNPDGVINLSVANAIIVLVILITGIILLNLLISIMGGLYSEVSSDAESEWRRKVCRTIIMQPHWLNKCRIERFSYIRRDMDVRKEKDRHECCKETTNMFSQENDHIDYKYDYTLFKCHLNDSDSLFQPSTKPTEQEIRIISINKNMLTTVMKVSRNNNPIYNPPSPQSKEQSDNLPTSDIPPQTPPTRPPESQSNVISISNDPTTRDMSSPLNEKIQTGEGLSISLPPQSPSDLNQLDLSNAGINPSREFLSSQEKMTNVTNDIGDINDDELSVDLQYEESPKALEVDPVRPSLPYNDDRQFTALRNAEDQQKTPVIRQLVQLSSLETEQQRQQQPIRNLSLPSPSTSNVNNYEEETI